jgi:hypothetical protein
MKFMVMHKHGANVERGDPIPPGLFERMGALIGGAVQSGILVDGDGLNKTITRSRVHCVAGVCTVEHGPFVGGHNELPAAFTKVQVGSRDEAIAIANEIARACGEDIDLEVGKLTEEWDITGAPPPEGVRERYLIQQKATSSTEQGKVTDLSAVHERLKAAGTFLGAAALTPSSQARRLQFQGKKRTIVDGPFAESKELIGGYAILEMPSLDAITAYATDYADILLLGADTLEIDIRPVA